MAIVVVLLGGCSSAPRRDPSDFFIAAGYDLGQPPSTSTTWERGIDLKYDFGRLADLGFDTVFVRNVAGDEAMVALDAAAGCNLEVALAVPLHDDAQAADRLQKSQNGFFFTPVATPAGRHRAFRTAFVDAGCDEVGAACAVDVCAAVIKAGWPCIPVFEASHLAALGADTPCERAGDIASDAPAVVDATALANDARSPKQRLLTQFHAALSNAQTTGLVLAGWRKTDAEATVSLDSLAAPRAAVASLIERAKRWGPRLVQSQALQPEPTFSFDPCFRVTVFVRGRRRHVLVFNPAPDHHVRGELRIPTRVAGARTTRAVQIPADRAAGAVFRASRSAILVPVTLAPGDAALFELF